MERTQIADETLETSALLHKLREQHAALEARLAEIDGHVALTAEEQVERARIKKLKLATKDRIARLVRAQQSGAQPAV